MAALKHVTIVFLFGVLFPPCFSKMEYLYFSSPGGADGAYEAGLYGGPVDGEKNETLKELYFSGYNCATLKGKEFDEIDINSVSYDPISRNVLLDMDPRLTVVSGPVCKSVDTCVNVTTMDLAPYFINAQGPQKMGPFAYYDSTIYFLLYEYQTIDRGTKEGKLELRKFLDDKCSDSYPVINTQVSFECTELIATVATERFEKYSGIKQADHLHVYRRPDGKLQFLTQTQRITFNGNYILTYDMELLSINEDGSVESLHKEPIKHIFFQLAFYQIGGISLRDGVLCWSTLTKLFCADWDHSDLSNIRTLLQDGQAATVCKGTERAASNVTSGVAIIETQPRLQVFFGCEAKQRGYGGAGIVRMPKDDKQGKPEISPLLNNGSLVLAGSMFLIEWCDLPAYILAVESGVAAAPTLPLYNIIFYMVLSAMSIIIMNRQKRR